MAAAKTATPTVQNKMITVEEVMDILQVSRSAAYHVMQPINKDLKEKGYITHSGRVPKTYLMERCGLQ